MATALVDYRYSYQNVPEEEVVRQASLGGRVATEYLVRKYRGLVESKARCYFLAGADHDDVVQEGMIGLFKAIRDYRGERLSRFRAFAELCVTRQIITAVKSATRQKHVPLNGYVSLNQPIQESESDGSLVECIADERAVDPEQCYVESREWLAMCEKIQSSLSDLETRVLVRYMQGKSYREMSRELNCHTKCIDNALQRVKRKVGGLLPERVNQHIA